ncbi:MAG: hypothetical protein IKC69_04295 [Clostridia bacterium]|nr:hypothetical protein [Clostridia bacterium]
MKFQIDHDLHIHSYISPCAKHDPRQTPEAILAYGIASGYGLLCVADHIWDRKVPSVERNPWLRSGLDVEKAKELLPLPRSQKCTLLFGIEADIDHRGSLALSREEFDTFDFIILSPSHLHLKGFTRDPERVGTTAIELKRYYQKRLTELLERDLPFHKCGLAHFTDCLRSDEGRVAVLDLFSDGELREIFSLAALRGIGIEINVGHFSSYSPEEKESILRPFHIAKEAGCRFYLGSDAHTPEGFWKKKEELTLLVELLGLTESDKHPFVREHLPSPAPGAEG